MTFNFNHGKYPDNRSQFKNKMGDKPDILAQAFNEFTQEFVMVSAMGTWVLIKSIFSYYCPLVVALLGVIIWVGYYISTEALHIQFIHNLEPTIFSYERLMVMYKIHRNYYWAGISLLFLSPLLLVMGYFSRSIATKYRLMFEKIGLRNGTKETPKMIKKKKVDKFRTKYIFDANGLGISEFEMKRERLEAHFREKIESIKYGKHRGRVEIIFNKQDFPEKLTYLELTKKISLPSNSFFIGHSEEGLLTQDISKLPHMLIAGTTGSGKTVFFKQVLMGLLEFTPHIQMYLVDLKGGLEMIDFVKAPNVRVVKTIEKTLEVFRQLEKEMKSRFKYLEKKGRKQIIPEVDKKDRIAVAVDEASVLYMNRGRYDPDRQATLEARRLADSIAKLSRAAAIHLLLATQKLENQVIPTSVTENVSGRMIFRVNSFQGSNQVIGSKDAMMLPEIPGRGIWSFGTKRLTIQAPFISERTIRSRCSFIEADFQSKRKTCFCPMIGEEEKRQKQETRNIGYSLIAKEEKKSFYHDSSKGEN